MFTKIKNYIFDPVYRISKDRGLASNGRGAIYKYINQNIGQMSRAQNYKLLCMIDEYAIGGFALDALMTRLNYHKNKAKKSKTKIKKLKNKLRKYEL